MARSLSQDQEYFFRTVIENHQEDGTVTKAYAGPFTNKGAATAAITHERKLHERYSRWGPGYQGPKKVTGYVEKTPVAWERVEDKD